MRHQVKDGQPSHGEMAAAIVELVRAERAYLNQANKKSAGSPRKSQEAANLPAAQREIKRLATILNGGELP